MLKTEAKKPRFLRSKRIELLTFFVKKLLTFSGG
jgi:hypothetical protein